MAFNLPWPGQPATGSAPVSQVVRDNLTAIAAFLNAIDGSLIQAGTVPATAMVAGANPITRWAEEGQNFVASGLLPGGFSGLNITVPAGVAYVSGTRVVSAGQGFTVAINQDTYIDMDNLGNFFANAVSNNAASPALSANRIRLGIVISNGTVITQYNGGNITATAPVISTAILTVSDSLGNRIYPTNPNGGLIAGRYTTAVHIGVSNGFAMAELAMTIQVPTGRMVELSAGCSVSENGTSTGEDTFVNILDGGVTILRAVSNLGGVTSWNSSFPTNRRAFSLSAGSHNLTVTLNVENGGLLTTDSSGAGFAAYLEARLI